MEQVAKRIKELIEDQSLSNTEFAKRTKLNPAIISHILGGRNKPSLQVIYAIKSEFTKVNLDYLLTGEGSLYNSKYTIVNSLEEDKSDTPEPEEEAIASTLQESDYKHKTPPLEDSSTTDSRVPEENPEPIYKCKETSPVTPDMGSDTKEIEQVMIFYTDGTFKTYRP